MLIKQCSLLLLATAALQTQAASVWKVSSDQHTLYIGGTIHTLSPEDYPLPTQYEEAYQAADKVVFETDIITLHSRAFRQKMMMKLSYSDGTTVKQVLNPNTYSALEQYLRERNIPAVAIQHLKPSSIALSLGLIELKRLGFTSEGVDEFYSNKALQDNKEQTWLEEPDAQIQMLADLNSQDESAMIDYALQDIRELPETMVSLRKNWREGNIEAMAEVGIKDFSVDYPEIYQALLVDRNNNWMPHIKSMLDDKTVEFIMVGTMHLAGPDSILTQLTASGYKIEKL
ncbi:TraB/GumN family protein [Marinomonas transparens]|uniref:TraB/GumN family protein n=1 Tax=Marinomonas transparens TaxID=2795388 RepID=A0A934JRF5_9GAMM|nr:TraB/GumN family protein [Marinomonas transparens]MBJ7539323.1 TraB/GumN family protein [Marinomonas transparens]